MSHPQERFDNASAKSPGAPRSLVIRLLVLAIIVAGIGGLTYLFRGSLTLESLAAREIQLRDILQAHPLTTLAAAFLLYVAVTGLSIPGATPMSLVYGWLFGFWTAVVLVSFASTTGASIAFLMSRYLIGGWVQNRFSERLVAFKKERGWRNLKLYSDTSGDFSRDFHAVGPKGEDWAGFNVFSRRDGTIRHFWSEEMDFSTADPGQDPRGAPDLMPIWTVLDCTPEGRDPNWYPKLEYGH